MTTEKTLTIYQLAEAAGCHVNTVRRAHRSGSLPICGVSDQGALLVTRAAAEAWISARAAAAAPKSRMPKSRTLHGVVWSLVAPGTWQAGPWTLHRDDEGLWRAYYNRQATTVVSRTLAGAAGKITAGQPTARKPAARKPAARKPAARKPATGKNGADEGHFLATGFPSSCS